MTKLIVDMEMCGKTVAVSVRHMDESLRHTGKIIHRNGYSIISVGCPQIQSRTLYVRGWSKGDDNRVVMYEFNTCDEASKWKHEIERLISEINNPAVELTVAEISERLGYEVKVVE